MKVLLFFTLLILSPFVMGQDSSWRDSLDVARKAYKNENYEKALKLKPDNEDALFNLKMANKRTIDKIDRLPELFIENTWKTLVTSKTVETWAYYAIGLLFLSLLLFISYLLLQQVIVKKTPFFRILHK